MVFTHLQKCDMLEAYLVCDKNGRRTQEYYSEKFPEREIPDQRYFLILYRRLRENEGVFKKKKKSKQFIFNEETEINVLGYFQAYPNNSIRDLSKEAGFSLGTIHRILKKHKFVPYKYQPVQSLHPGDNERRLVFSHWFINECHENPNFFRHIFWSDESNFSNSGMFNSKTHHYWSHENPFLVHPRNPQNRFSLNVWCGMVGSRIVGPFFYRGSLTGQRYVEFMSEILENFLDNLNLLDRPLIHFQQDGAPAHNYHGTNELLRRLFGNRWIGTNGPILWPPRSPDMTPLDFYLWGHVKNEVYKTRYATVDELQNAITMVIRNIDGRTILKATRSVQKRLMKCVEQEGNIFEHVL